MKIEIGTNEAGQRLDKFLRKYLKDVPLSCLLYTSQSVMGGISLMLFSMIALVGVKTIKNEGVKLNKTNLILMASIIFVGLSGLVLSLIHI